MATVAALVPAEILAAHAFLLPSVLSLNTSSAQAHVTVSDRSAARLLLVGLTAISCLLYLLARRTSPRTRWTYVRMLIPPSAFLTWTLLEMPSALDGFDVSLSKGLRLVIGVLAAVVLSALAVTLEQLDKK